MEPANSGGVEVDRRPGILYPMLLISAIAVIAFSIAGTATVLGWLPEPGTRAAARAVGDAPSGRALWSRAPRAPAGCADCGVVESMLAVEVKGEGTGLGAVAGGVVGGVLGSKISRGNGVSAAAVVGASAGALAGHEIEKKARGAVNYQVRVRMHDGTQRTYYEAAQPELTVGQKVRITERGLVAEAQ